MKARIKATGEVVNIRSINTTCGSTIMVGDIEVFTDSPTVTAPSIDWEQREWEASVAAMQGLLANPNRELRYDSTEMFTIECLSRAKSLIEEFKKQQNV